MVADADPAAEIQTRDRKPESAQFEDQLGDPIKGAPIGLEIGQLRADMHGEADRLDAGKLTGEPVCGKRLVNFDAEFVLLPAGRDLGVGMRIDIWVYPDRDARDPVLRAGDFAQAAQLRQRFDIDLMDAGIERRPHLRRRFADAGEDDPLWRHAGGERSAQLPLRDDVGTCAEAGEEPEYREVRVCLDGIADQRPLG